MENKNDVSFEFRYSLTYEEAYRTFYIMANKFSKKVRVILSAVLTITCLGMLYLQYHEPAAIQYTVLTVIAIAILFNLIYSPTIKAKKGAAAVKKANGEYIYSISKDGYINLHNGERISFIGDKYARVFETDSFFILRPDRFNTFCIPKRILNEIEQNELRNILKSYYKKFLKIT